MPHVLLLIPLHIYAIVLGGEGGREEGLFTTLILHEIWVPKIQTGILHS